MLLLITNSLFFQDYSKLNMLRAMYIWKHIAGIHWFIYLFYISFIYFHRLYAHECFSNMCVCTTCVFLVPLKGKREHWIPWNWSYGWLPAIVGYWEWDMGPLQEQLVLLNTVLFHSIAFYYLSDQPIGLLQRQEPD